MYVNTTDYLNSGYSSQTDSTTADGDLGKDDFLNLFVAQLQNQDPLDPMDDTQTLAQLAQFSSLEQLTNINTALSDLTDSLSQQAMTGAVSYIGKDVMAGGYMISKSGEDVSSVTYTVPLDAEDVTAMIFDEDGNIVKTVDVGKMDAGEYDFEWDGTATDGTELDDGIYSIAFAAETADGEPMSVSTMVSGLVTGISQSGGSTILQLEDGREVDLSNVWNVTTHQETSDDAQAA